MKKILFLLFISCSAAAQSKVKYTVKAEAGYLKFLTRTITVDPGPQWRGYYLSTRQNGLDINVINGITIKEKLFVGIGVGYNNFEGINGANTFAEVEYESLQKRFSPLFHFRAGYIHIRNQYDGGRGTASAEFGLGVNCRITEKHSVYLKTGLLACQQSSLVPIRLGFRF